MRAGGEEPAEPRRRPRAPRKSAPTQEQELLLTKRELLQACRPLQWYLARALGLALAILGVHRVYYARASRLRLRRHPAKRDDGSCTLTAPNLLCTQRTQN